MRVLTPSGASGLPEVVYWQVAWSPIGRRLALAFFFMVPTHQPPTGAGLLLLDGDGGHPHVLLQPQATAWSVAQEWDLVRGTPLQVVPSASSGAFATALAYRWGAGGTLVPDGILSQDRVLPAPPRGPVGNPDGGTSFTLWQPGAVFRAGAAPASVLYGFGTGFSAWSPDGRYLILGLNPAGVLVPVGQPPPSRQDLDPHPSAPLPFAPMRDSALQVASNELLNPFFVAWRPDGRVLAAYKSHRDQGSGNGVVLYDCATGQRLATLPLPMTPLSLAGIEASLRWSPDGSRLLLSSAQWGLVVLWGPDQLPAPGVG
jgi:hypothetical protein